MIIYLYVKSHSITGLKYFGKTTNRNPHTYTGSGLYWKRHLKKYGKTFTTEIVFQTNNINEASEFALRYSEENNIVSSNEWANLVTENGLDGQSPGFKNHSLSEYNRAHSGVNHISKQPGFVPSRLGKKDTPETIAKKSKPRPHTAGVNNPVHGYQWSEEQKAVLKEKRKGKVWWHNNVIATMSIESPGENWFRGRLPKLHTI